MMRTERLAIRPLALTDLDDLLPYHSNPEVVRYIPWTVRDEVEVLAYIKRVSNPFEPTVNGSYFMAGFALLENDRVIGQINAGVESVENSQASIGWVINPNYSGKGYATEAVIALMRYLIRDLGFRRLTAKIDPQNIASARLAERVGMRLEATFIEDEYLKGELVSTQIWAILDREFRF